MSKIYIYGDVGDWGGDDVTAKSVIEQLADIEGDIDVHINSGGGSVTEGFAVYNVLQNHKSKGKITVYIDALAASIASYIAMVGDEIVMAENASIMIHNPWNIAMGDSRDLRDMADQLDRFGALLVKGYTKRTGKSSEEIQAMLDREAWFDADEAVEFGFADRVVEDGNSKIAAMVSVEIFNKYKNAPAVLSAQVLGDVKMEEEEIETTEEAEIIEEKVEDVEEKVEEIEDDVDDLRADVDELLELAGLAGEGIETVKAFRREGLTMAQARARLIDMKAEKGKIMARNKSRADVTQVVSAREKAFKGMQAAINAKAGLQPLDPKNEFNRFNLIGTARAALEVAGMDTRFMADDMIITHAMNRATSDFPMLLTGCAAGTLLAGYEEVEEVFEKFTQDASAPDFRPTKFAGLTGFEALRERAENAEYENIDVKEFGEPLQLGEYGGRFSLSRRAMINDNLGAFTDIPRQLGMAAKRTIGDKVFSVMLANPTLSDTVVAFAAGRSNYLTGGSSALSATSLATAIKNMRLRKDAAGGRLDLRPQYLIVPAALEATARALVENPFDSAGNGQNPNPLFGSATVLVDTRIDASANGGTKWFLTADPRFGGGFAVGYLNGNKAPRLEEEIQFSNDALVWKVGMDFAAGFVNPLTLSYAVGQ